MIYTTRNNDRMQSDQLKFKMNTKIGISGIKSDSNLRRPRSNAIANKSQTPSDFQSYLWNGILAICLVLWICLRFHSG